MTGDHLPVEDPQVKCLSLEGNTIPKDTMLNENLLNTV